MNSQDYESYVPVYDMVPEKWEQAREFLVEHLKKISNAVNIREIGWFLDEELLSGKAFVPGVAVAGIPQQYRTVFRKVIDFGALPDTATKSVAHDITFDANFTLVQLYAASTNPTTLSAIAIPHVGIPATNAININIDAANVNITTASNRTLYTRTYVVIEYLMEL